jgi:hypothetical protein
MQQTSSSMIEGDGGLAVRLQSRARGGVLPEEDGGGGGWRRVKVRIRDDTTECVTVGLTCSAKHMKNRGNLQNQQDHGLNKLIKNHLKFDSLNLTRFPPTNQPVGLVCKLLNRDPILCKRIFNLDRDPN